MRLKGRDRKNTPLVCVQLGIEKSPEPSGDSEIEKRMKQTQTRSDLVIPLPSEANSRNKLNDPRF